MKQFSGSGSNLSDAVGLDISEKDVIGRDEETKILQNVLNQVIAGRDAGSDDAEIMTTISKKKPELVLVAGASGTGKSCLIKTALKSKVKSEHNGFYIVGKIDQYEKEQNGGAYSAFGRALEELCDQIDRHDDRDEIVSKIKESLGDNFKRLSTFIPGLAGNTPLIV